MPLSPQQLQPFNFYITENQALPPLVSDLLGTFQMAQDASQNLTLTYTRGGPCTAGANDPSQTLPVTFTAPNTFTSVDGITLAGVTYTGVNFSWDNQNNVWVGSAGQSETSTLWMTANHMIFPYESDYILMVYDSSPRGSQQNGFGGLVAFPNPATTNGSKTIQLNIGGATGNGTLRTQSSQLNFGLVTGGLSVALNNAVTYTFQTMFFAFTDVDSRAVIWGNLQISGQTGQFQYVAIRWPAVGLPGLGWSVLVNDSPVGMLTVSNDVTANPFITFQSGNTSIGVSAPNPLITWTDPNGTGTYTGMAQLTILGPNGTTNPSSHPSGITWDFGGRRSSSVVVEAGELPPPGVDDDWTSVQVNGQPITTGLVASAQKSYA